MRLSDSRYLLGAAIAIALAACQGDGSDNAADADTTAAAQAGAVPERPQTRQDTIMIEGMPEVSSSTLFRAPDELGLPFSTYVPAGIEPEVSDGDDGGINFVAAFDGVVEPLAYMFIRPYPPGTDIDEVRNVIGGFLRGRLADDDPVDVDDVVDAWQRVEPPAWALDAYELDYRWGPDRSFTGRVIIARHDATLFHIITHYPAEYGDGLSPRFDAILDDWRWEDTGTMLRGG